MDKISQTLNLAQTMNNRG